MGYCNHGNGVDDSLLFFFLLLLFILCMPGLCGNQIGGTNDSCCCQPIKKGFSISPRDGEPALPLLLPKIRPLRTNIRIPITGETGRSYLIKDLGSKRQLKGELRGIIHYRLSAPPTLCEMKRYRYFTLSQLFLYSMSTLYSCVFLVSTTMNSIFRIFFTLR